jgi:hypothetical protein
MRELYPTPAEAQLAADIRRGTARLLLDLDCASLAEVTLPNGRRADLLAVDAGCEISVIEIKSSPADFRADQKWGDYLAFADRFYFAVAPGFPLQLLPAEEGIVLADRFAGSIHRPAIHRPLPPARRRSLLLRFARLGALRLLALSDPEAASQRWEG